MCRPMIKLSVLKIGYWMCFWQENKWNETNVKYIRIHVYEYIKRILDSNLLDRDRKPKYKKILKQNGDGKRRPLTPSFRPGLADDQPLKRHHAQSLLGPASNDPRTLLKTQKATNWGGVAGCKIEVQCKGGVGADSMSSLIIVAGERRGSLGAGLENIQPPAILILLILFHSCWITETQPLNLCVCFYLFLFCLWFPEWMKIAFILAHILNNVVVSFGTLKVQSFMLTEVRETVICWLSSHLLLFSKEKTY